MRVLHICADYPYTPVYRALLRSMVARSDAEHVMYVPLKKGRGIPPGFLGDQPGYDVRYSIDFQNYERILYYRKRRKIARSLCRHLDVSSFDLVHCHYVFAAGGVWRELDARCRPPLVVTVRNSDVNTFFRYLRHLRAEGVRIMEDAERIIFLTPALRRTLFHRRISSRVEHALKSKLMFSPSGIHDDWFVAEPMRRDHPESPLRMLFVGELTYNKNVTACVDACASLREAGVDVTLTIVGRGPAESKIRRRIERRNVSGELVGFVTERAELQRIYRQHDVFIMPSRTETFGLVYVEAMSQGLPIIYTRGQGIDGCFEEGTVGFASDPYDIDGMVNGVRRIVSDYARMSNNCVDAAREFTWSNAADRHLAAYAEVVR